MKPTIKNLVCSGGGARGVAYGGAAAALEETGLLNEITHIAGSSAGAITAALLAVGMPVSELQETLKTTDFSELLGERSPHALFTKNAYPLHKFIQTSICKTVKDFLEKQSTISGEYQTILQNMQKDEPSLTFKDLNTLCLAFPGHFKHLSITAVKKRDGSLQWFNHDNTPDVDIALACKASGAIPAVLEPVKINDEMYVDGGVYNNIPTEAFEKPDTEANKEENERVRRETLVFTFLEGNPYTPLSLFQRIKKYLFCNDATWNALYGSSAHQARNDPEPPPLFTPHWWEVLWRDYFMYWFSGLNTNSYSPTQRKDACFQSIREYYAQRTVTLNIGDILAIDFTKATKIAEPMLINGYLDTMDMIFNHQLSPKLNNDYTFCLNHEHCPTRNDTINPPTLKEKDLVYYVDNPHHIEAQKNFYNNIVTHFLKIYETTSTACGQIFADDPFYQLLQNIKIIDNAESVETAESARTLYKYYLIRDKCHENVNSIAMFALMRAVEYQKNEIDVEEIKNDIAIYASQKKTSFYHCFLWKTSKTLTQDIDLTLEACAAPNDTYTELSRV